jgi:hypothetical protein
MCTYLLVEADDMVTTIHIAFLIFFLLQGECSNGAFTLLMSYFIIEDVISVSMKLNSPVRLWNFCVYCLKIALSVCLVLGFDLLINSCVSFLKKMVEHEIEGTSRAR